MAALVTTPCSAAWEAKQSWAVPATTRFRAAAAETTSSTAALVITPSSSPFPTSLSAPISSTSNTYKRLRPKTAGGERSPPAMTCVLSEQSSEIDVIGIFSTLRQDHPDLTTVLRECRRGFLSVAVFSAMVNLLMLAGPLYMLQVYDRVLSSHSVPTLVALSILLVAAYTFQGAFEVLRSHLTARIASLLDVRLGVTLFEAVIRLTNRNFSAAHAHQPLRDLDQIRAFLTSSAPIALVDLPWMPVFLAICFLIHPLLGATALAGAIALTTLTILTERRSRASMSTLTQTSGARTAASEVVRRGSETIAAMGMSGTLAQRWQRTNNEFLTATARVSDAVGTYSGISKVIRLLLQSSMLGMGSYLVIQQELNAGAMFAASLMMGRALAPIDVVIANWRSLVGARQSLLRLS